MLSGVAVDGIFFTEKDFCSILFFTEKTEGNPLSVSVRSAGDGEVEAAAGGRGEGEDDGG